MVILCMYVCMYEIRDRQDPVKGSGWVLFPSTMAEQPIHVCMYVCMYEIRDCQDPVKGSRWVLV